MANFSGLLGVDEGAEESGMDYSWVE